MSTRHNHTAVNAPQDIRIAIDKRAAYHKAGHAAAIHLGNKQKQLPAVHFQIIIKLHEGTVKTDRFARQQSKYVATVEGGRLIQSLPLSFAEVTQDFSGQDQEECLRAFEADVINLLAGSLAEAKYLLARDNEAFSPNLVNLSALHFYGGSPDQAIITEYMECFLLDEVAREQKLGELFAAAFCFVNNPSNWCAICGLAEFIRDQPVGIISCEEVIALLQSRLAA
jgi:hypothetical protein